MHIIVYKCIRHLYLLYHLNLLCHWSLQVSYEVNGRVLVVLFYRKVNIILVGIRNLPVGTLLRNGRNMTYTSSPDSWLKYKLDELWMSEKNRWSPWLTSLLEYFTQVWKNSFVSGENVGKKLMEFGRNQITSSLKPKWGLHTFSLAAETLFHKKTLTGTALIEVGRESREMQACITLSSLHGSWGTHRTTRFQEIQSLKKNKKHLQHSRSPSLYKQKNLILADLGKKGMCYSLESSEGIWFSHRRPGKVNLSAACQKQAMTNAIRIPLLLLKLIMWWTYFHCYTRRLFLVSKLLSAERPAETLESWGLQFPFKIQGWCVRLEELHYRSSWPSSYKGGCGTWEKVLPPPQFTRWGIPRTQSPRSDSTGQAKQVTRVCHTFGSQASFWNGCTDKSHEIALKAN